MATATTTRDRKLGRLLSDHPAVGDALLAGHISVDHALQIERTGANPRIGHLLATVVGVFVDEAEHTEFREFAGQVDQFIQLADQDGAFTDLASAVEGSPSPRVRCRRNAARVGVRPNGTIILKVGERSPDLSIDELTNIIRSRAAALGGLS